MQIYDSARTPQVTNIDRRQLIIRQPDDWHVHLRDDAILQSVLPYTASQFARAIVMPNLDPPIISKAMARSYRDRILAAIPPELEFTPLMTCFLTDRSDSEEIAQGFFEGIFIACKLYPSGATTNSDGGVTNIKNIYKVLDRLQTIGMPLLIHGEVIDKDVDVFDREAVFIDRILKSLVKDFPNLKIVLEHITTIQSIEFVQANSDNIAATITPHHLIINRNAMFDGGIRPHNYCLPLAKREAHRLALRKAATSGSKKFFLGTDSAPHAVSRKETSCGCAGIFNAPCAIETYAQVFEEENKLDALEPFSSINGSIFYGLPLNNKFMTLHKSEKYIAEEIKIKEQSFIPFNAGKTINWTIFEIR
jgi:dihydroorotase